MTIRIAVNGRFLARKLTGVDRFALETMRAFDKLLVEQPKLRQRVAIRLIVPAQCKTTVAFKHIAISHTGKLPGMLWEQISLPLSLGKDEQLVNLCNTAPIWRKSHIWVLHDAATKTMPEVYDWKFRLWYQLLIPVLLRTATHRLTVSEFSRRDIAQQYGIPESKIGLIGEGGEHIHRLSADESILDRYGLSDKPYVFAVSSMAKHKNFQLVLQALELIDQPPFQVAIAGGLNPSVFGSSAATCDGGASSPIHWLGYVSDEELKALYQGAACFVFPSTYEGFGIPPLEAMNCGTPVLASDAASIPEVCGDAAMYFQPTNPQALADKLATFFANPQLAKQMSQAGLERAKQFSWEQAAKCLLHCMETMPAEAHQLAPSKES